MRIVGKADRRMSFLANRIFIRNHLQVVFFADLRFSGVQDCSKKTKSDPIAVHKGRAMIRALEHEVMSGLPQSKGETTIDIFVLWAAIRHDGERDALEECLRCHFHAPFRCLILPKHFELEAVLPQVDHADSSHHIISLALGPCTKL